MPGIALRSVGVVLPMCSVTRGFEDRGEHFPRGRIRRVPNNIPPKEEMS